MPSAALEMQYSPRLIDAVSAESDETKISLYPPGSADSPGLASQ